MYPSLPHGCMKVSRNFSQCAEERRMSIIVMDGLEQRNRMKRVLNIGRILASARLQCEVSIRHSGGPEIQWDEEHKEVSRKS